MYPYSNWIINHKESSNEELVRNYAETQDEEAFNEIVRCYADKIYMLALRITCNLRDADEVLQEVFLTMEKLNTFPGESKFSNWLHRVVENASYKHLRAKKGYKKEVSLEDHASYNESGALMAVNEFPMAYRFVFLLRDVELLTYHEVAEILGFSLPADMSKIHGARLLLRDKLSGYFNEWRK